MHGADADARNFTQPSCSSWPAVMSVVSGFASVPPSNGKPISVPGEVNFDASASITSLLPRAASHVGLAGIEHVLADARVDQRSLAVHVLHPLREAPALPLLAARLRLERAVEAVRSGSASERSIVDAAERVDQVFEVREVDDDDVVDVDADELRGSS